jgi:bifunctional DNA-binding transcriptional regulator/antitoxin component of YhaV-PrlF toxin-antitoxin module
MTSYILEIQENEDGELYIELPDEVIEELGWKEGDILSWDLKGEGVILSRLNEEAGYEVIEE